MAKPRSSIKPATKSNRYSEIIAAIFRNHYRPGVESFDFERSELEAVAKKLNIVLPKNLGDLLYSFRFRSALPDSIASTAPADREWSIELAGRAKYRMCLRKIVRILPNPNLYKIKIPDATPELVAAHALTDEQALLAKIRYNRLVDLFLRVTAYSLQNHLRTSVPEMGQIETDEIYVALNNHGQQFVVPIQAKGGDDQIGGVQIRQDLALCEKSFPNLTPRPIAVQFVRDSTGETLVMFELIVADGEINVLDEKQYRLVPASEITPEDLAIAKQSSASRS